MTFELSDTEAIYLYGILRKELKSLESVKPSSLVKADVKLYKYSFLPLSSKRTSKVFTLLHLLSVTSPITIFLAA